jgi:signal transduction histidine kinase
MQFLKIWLWKLKRFLPENRVQAEYFEMLHKLKKLEAQVEKSAKQLEMAKTSFLKNLYHEIRTPLNSIMGFTNLIAKENKITQAELEEYVNLMNKSSNDFLRIMDDIIQASLLEAGMINVKKDTFNLGAFLEEVHLNFNVRKHILEKTSIALLCSIPKKFHDLEIVFDKQHVNQVLIQLLENAFKFTEKGSIEFGVKIKEPFLEFFVKDSGVGKLSGKEKYIFGTFTKIDISDNSKNGLGLGLAISKKLVELMGGKIWCHSKPGKGATFYFTVPYQPVNEELENTPETIAERILKNQKSLVV